MIEFTIHEVPVPLSRPRFSRRGHVYTPDKCQKAKQRIGIAALSKMQGTPPLDGPVELSILFGMKMPKRPKPHQANGMFHTSRPDITNLVKLVEDSLNKILWNDDSQICTIITEKRYAVEPFTLVRVRQINRDDQG